MRRIATVIMLFMLMISGCSMIVKDNEATIAEEFDNKSEASVIVDELSSNGDFAEDKEQSFSDMYPNSDIYLDLDLEDGVFYKVPRLTMEEEEVFVQSDNCAESLSKRLESYGVFLNSDIIPIDRASSFVDYSFLPMFIGHYKDCDLLYIRYSGYRGTDSGNLYIFQNSLLIKYISSIGEIDFDDCFRTIGENIWFVITQHSGGSGMHVKVKEWINLTKDNIPVELYYTSYYGTGNYRYRHDIDFSLDMIYSALEEELYINEQNIPVLKISWQKEVSVEKEQSYEEIISLKANGYDDYAIDAAVDWEDFDVFNLSSGDLLDGLDEQLNILINHGTEEEKHIAKLLVDNFATVPIS